MTRQKSETEKIFNHLPIFMGVSSATEEAELRKVKKYRFSNLRAPGLSHTFTYGTTKNKLTLTLHDQGIYLLPTFLALWLESLGTPIYDEPEREDLEGQVMAAVNKMPKVLGMRYRFQLREIREK